MPFHCKASVPRGDALELNAKVTSTPVRDGLTQKIQWSPVSRRKVTVFQSTREQRSLKCQRKVTNLRVSCGPESHQYPGISQEIGLPFLWTSVPADLI